jgi:hypothetical protein
MNTPILLISFLSVIIWAVALIGLCSRRDIDVHSKISWVVVLLVFHGLGAIIYFIFSPKETPTEIGEDLSSPSSCMQCDTAIPSGEDTCQNCGWTYKS